MTEFYRKIFLKCQLLNVMYLLFFIFNTLSQAEHSHVFLCDDCLLPLNFLPRCTEAPLQIGRQCVGRASLLLLSMHHCFCSVGVSFLMLGITFTVGMNYNFKCCITCKQIHFHTGPKTLHVIRS